MTRVPFAARVAAGLAVTAVEEVRRLPSTALTLPMTVISEVLQSGMRFQQQVTQLAIKGDLALSALPIIGTPVQQQPSWATFDEDDGSSSDAPMSDAPMSDVDVPDREERDSGVSATGRFALYSTPPTEQIDIPDAIAPAKTRPKAVKKAAATPPEIAEYLDYDTVTLAQLRARLRTLSVDDLTELLDYENATLGRAPFQTMLANRITTAKAK